MFVPPSNAFGDWLCDCKGSTIFGYMQIFRKTFCVFTHNRTENSVHFQRKWQKKHFFEKKMQKYLVMSKKSSTFAPAFEEQACLRPFWAEAASPV